MSPDIEDGICFICAKFNYAGELKNGTIKIVGGIPTKAIPKRSILLQGSIINVDTFKGDNVFRADFLFRINVDHPLLEYNSHIGIWKAYVVIPGWPPFFYRYLFRRTWGPASVPLNSYIGQVKNIV